MGYLLGPGAVIVTRLLVTITTALSALQMIQCLRFRPMAIVVSLLLGDIILGTEAITVIAHTLLAEWRPRVYQIPLLLRVTTLGMKLVCISACERKRE